MRKTKDQLNLFDSQKPSNHGNSDNVIHLGKYMDKVKEKLRSQYYESVIKRTQHYFESDHTKDKKRN